MCLLAIAGISGALLAAVQIVPAWSWIATSDRAVFTYPRSVYEVPAYLRRERPIVPVSSTAGAAASPGGWKGVAQGLWGSPVESEHHRQAYRFSVAPWRLVEMLWPNVSGRTFPQNHRWLAAVGGEDPIWTPSLYLGILPLLLGIGTWRLRRADARVQWFSWIFLLAVVGSFGWYGLGLLWQSVQRRVHQTNRPTSPVAEPVGGMYWFMTVVVAGVRRFPVPGQVDGHRQPGDGRSRRHRAGSNPDCSPRSTCATGCGMWRRQVWSSPSSWRLTTTWWADVAGAGASRRALRPAGFPRRVARRVDGLCAHGTGLRRGLVAAASQAASTQSSLESCSCC